MPSHVYTALLSRVRVVAGGSYTSPSVPDGHRWVVTDLTCYVGGTQWQSLFNPIFAYAYDAGTPVPFFVLDKGSRACGPAHHWSGRQVINTGYWLYLQNSSSLPAYFSVTGFDLTLP